MQLPKCFFKLTFNYLKFNVNVTCKGKQKLCVLKLRLKVSMESDERISRGIELQIAGAEQRKEREPQLVWGGDSVCQRSGKNGQVGDSR